MLTPLFLTVFIYLLGFGIIIPLLPSISRDFGADALTLGLLMSVFSFFQFLMAPFWGRLSDRLGRRPILIFCMAGECFSYLLFAYSTTLTGLFIARSLAGVFGGAISTASAYVSDVTEKSERSKGMGVIGAAFGLGFLIGPAMGGGLTVVGKWIGDKPPWGLSFPALCVAALCLITLAFVYFRLPEPKKRKLLSEKKSRIGVFKTMIKNPLTGWLVLVYLLTNLGFAIMEPTLFLKVFDEFGWTPEMASFGFAYVGLMMVFTQGFLVRRLLPKFGEAPLMLIGTFFMALSLMGIGFAPVTAILAVAVTAMALGSGIYNPSILGSLSLSCDDDIQGEVFGVTQSISALARIIGPAVGGALYGAAGVRSTFAVAGGLVFLAVIILMSFYKKLPSEGKRIDGV